MPIVISLPCSAEDLEDRNIAFKAFRFFFEFRLPETSEHFLAYMFTRRLGLTLETMVVRLLCTTDILPAPIIVIIYAFFPQDVFFLLFLELKIAYSCETSQLVCLYDGDAVYFDIASETGIPIRQISIPSRYGPHILQGVCNADLKPVASQDLYH